MNIRLFNDNGCETPTPDGNLWSDLVANALKPLVQRAMEQNVSLRDLTTVVLDEITILTAENRLRKGMAERKAERGTHRRNLAEEGSQVSP